MVGVDSLQHLHRGSQPVVVADSDVLIQLVVRLVQEESAHTTPVEATVTATRSVLVLDTVVEGETEDFRSVVPSPPVVESRVISLVWQTSAVQG